MNDQIDINPDTSISDRRDSIILDRPFILTQDKTLVTGMPYMLLEGNRTKAIRLLDIEIVQGIVYLMVQELKSPKTFTLSWNVEYEGDYYLWTLADYDTLSNLSK